MKEIFKFILAVILFIPFSFVVLITYSCMLLTKEILIFLGEWEE